MPHSRITSKAQASLARIENPGARKQRTRLPVMSSSSRTEEATSSRKAARSCCQTSWWFIVWLPTS